MSTITPEEMAIADENSEYLGVPRLLLMENAGRAIANVAKEKLKKIPKDKVVIIAGTGNNGGDGLACARHLANQADVIVILLGRAEEIKTEEASKNWQIIEKMILNIQYALAPDAQSLENLKSEIESADIIIDAIFGTGIKGKIREPFSSAIDIINSSKGFKIAIDIPSGLDPLTGDVHDKSVKADVTVTLHKMKPGLMNRKEITGDIIISPIGMPPEAEIIAGPGDVRYSMKPRHKYSKKGDFGRLLIVGGSKEYSGAPTLAALAALRTGVDIAIIAAPKSVADVIRSFSPNLIVRRLKDDYLTSKDIPELKSLSERCTSIVAGPGLGLEEETKTAILSFMKEVGKDKPMLVDADALKALSEEPTCLKNYPTIITPHAGEFEIVTHSKIAPPDKLKDRIKQVQREAKIMGLTILLKGHEDIISDGDNFKIKTTGNPGMTVGGTGDVLSGIAATFLAWGVKPFRAACAAAFVSGFAGDLAVRDRGYHIVATDVIEKIHEVLKKFDTPPFIM
ncbi:MAG: NAD(P)H-hydrate dehydratase [archaeon]|nr:NAD(P)H-hydrate dehydratase [archaeon]